MVDKEKDVVLDMTKAATMDVLPVDRPYLAAISAWRTGMSGAGNRKIHVELTVTKPEEKGVKGRKLMDDLSFDNEFTLGRFQNLLIALGHPEAEVKDNPKFKVPKEDDVLGMECTVWLRVEESEEFGNRNRIKRVGKASVYTEVVSAS